MDTNYLRHAAVCTTELTRSAMRACFREIQLASIKHWGGDGHGRAMRSVHPCMWSIALVAFMTPSGEDGKWTPSVLAAMKAVYDYMSAVGQHIRSDTSWTRLVCVDIARVVQHCNDPTLPSDCKDIARRLLKDDLPEIMLATAEAKLGIDVRQYVTSTLDQALEGLDGTATEDSATMRALRSVRCIVQCVPPPGAPDYKHDSPEFEVVRSQAVRALEAFSRFLSTPRALVEDFADPIDDVIKYALRFHGEQAGQRSSELQEAIDRYSTARNSQQHPDSDSVRALFAALFGCEVVYRVSFDQLRHAYISHWKQNNLSRYTLTSLEVRQQPQFPYRGYVLAHISRREGSCTIPCGVLKAERTLQTANYRHHSALRLLIALVLNLVSSRRSGLLAVDQVTVCEKGYRDGDIVLLRMRFDQEDPSAFHRFIAAGLTLRLHDDPYYQLKLELGQRFARLMFALSAGNNAAMATAVEEARPPGQRTNVSGELGQRVQEDLKVLRNPFVETVHEIETEIRERVERE
ncbi:hypothetical protein K466DRAFT_602702 [Polyporus arcularius HHB13444]|uniref:Uncharacterized protein n=1 Tax=Polyporus arcularius HHB13444 TaxID=1314778 RepID=A0A5C3P2A3_9APHY|nr:hypothetical protein K466DRAFT_602702 [Polyporus arcularius HHB13444]